MLINTLRFYLCVRVSVCDGCGRGRNDFAGRVQNHHVRFSFQLSQKWPAILIYLEKAAAGLDTLRCRLREGPVVGACHRTINGQEHKIVCRAGPEQDTIFHLRVTACREQGKNCRAERLAGVASR